MEAPVVQPEVIQTGIKTGARRVGVASIINVAQMQARKVGPSSSRLGIFS